MSKNAERGQATRQRLISVATRLFAERGFEGTSIDAILHEAGVSRGSLYHHFGSKEALFEAALTAIMEETGRQTVVAAAGASDAASALRAGCVAWVRLASDPVVQRVMLIDAPAVLGWQRWRDLDEQQALGLLTAGLRAAAREGRLQPELVDMFAHVLAAALAEIALVIARAEDPDGALRSGETAVDELLQRLLGA
ncbi:MAG TPA: helix-turn-helix domain-containing protein [Acidimicrobiales bacterium]|nr:helix-turn-helix domain-containing protein [Acidimicrobiales bacterium]